MIQNYYPKSDQETTSTLALWTYVEAPTKAELSHLVGERGLTMRLLHDALDQYEIPRLENIGETIYIITRFAFLNNDGGVSTAPILFVLRSDELITVAKDHLPRLENLIEDGEHALTDAKDPILLMLNILLEIDSQYDAIINERSKRIRHLHNRLGKRDVGIPDYIGFVALEDSLNDLLNSLEPTNAALRHLLSTDTLHDFAGHRELVDTVILNNEQSIQACTARLKSLDSIRRAYSLINAHRLDRTIKILTLASVFIAIPTMFFSMYGMNIPLPWMRAEETFIIMLFICSVLLGAAYAIGRKKHMF